MSAPSKSLGADFLRLLFGQTISVFGSSITRFALPLLVYELTHSALHLASVMAIIVVPQILLALPIGALVDRVPRRKLLLASNLVLAAVVAGVPALSHFGWFSLPWLYLGAFLVSTFSVVIYAAEFASVALLVPAEDLVRANGRIQGSYAVASALGPTVAGAVVRFVGVPKLLLVDALSYVFAAAMAASISSPLGDKREASETRTLGADVKEGLAFVATHPVLRTLALLFFLSNFVQATVHDQLILLAKEHLRASDAMTGALFSLESVGFILAALVAQRLGAVVPFGRLILGASLIHGVFAICMGLSHSVFLALPLWALAGAGELTININTSSLRQRIVPPRLLGRVGSVSTMLASIAIPFGSLLGGTMIEHGLPVGRAYVLCGASAIALALLFGFSPLWKATAQDEAHGLP